MANKQSIIIDARVQTTLEGMNEVVSKLKKGLSEGATKVDLTKGVGNSLSKEIEKFKTEYDKFTRMTAGGKLEFGDSKDAIHSGEQMIKIFKELQRVVGNFEELSVFDAKKLFPQAFDSRVSELQEKMRGFQDTLSKLQVKEIDLTQAKSKLAKLQNNAELIQNSLNQEINMRIDTSETDQALEQAKKKVIELREELKKSLKAKETAALGTISQGEARRTEIQEARKQRGASSKPTLVSLGKGASEDQIKSQREAIVLWEKEQKELDELAQKIKTAEKEKEKYVKAYTGADTADLASLAQATGADTDKIDEINAALSAQTTAADNATRANEELRKSQDRESKLRTNLTKANTAVKEQEVLVEKLQGQYDILKQKLSAEGMKKAFGELGIDFSPEMLKNEESVKNLQAALNGLDKASLGKLVESLKKMGLTSKEAENFVESLKGELRTVDDSTKDIKRATDEMENLKNQVLRFFSITNAIQLFKRTVQSALNTVKELDATMTEAAVVTDFSIGDMWDQLPKYSAEAQKLGVSINGMYQATTLYYQQGLKNNEAMALGVETMKMAKIAAMDSTEATTAMTAALRGFNMELNETSATRVNDVYSQLAAVTAADTNQIATAMEKTASIASSANMEFETTAALLAQIIETTQEAPETAGTALKTIIARFSEVKSLREQGLTTGEDEEGEVIDVNKIQTALRSVGISMDEYFAGTEGLDKVLLRLSEKWNTLDFETQRYIATMAAGSRQQSRFIAMMSDYGRTQELVTAANNSAGASQRQYEKTLDSLQTSLTRLKNAWDEFTMGLANNEILKTGVDILTGLLETINKITDAISGNNGMTQSIVSLIAVVGALKGGKSLLGGLTQKMGGAFGMGSYIETTTDGTDKDGNPVKIVSRQPYKDGKENGIQAGNGWIDGWKQATAGAKGEKGFGKVPGFFQGMFRDSIGTEGKTERTLDRDALKRNVHDKWQAMEDERTAKKGGFKKTSKAQKELKSLEEQLDDTSLSTEELAEKYKKLGGEISESSGIIKTSTKEMPKYKTSVDSVVRGVSSLGSAAVGAGSAMLLLGSALSAMGEEEAAEAVTTIGSYVTAIGSLAMMAPEAVKGVKSLASHFKISTGKMVGWLAIIALVIAAIIKLIDTLKKFGEARKLSTQIDAVNDKIADLGEAADEAKNKINDIASSRTEFDKLKKQFEGLTKGTKEWRQQLVDSNQQVLGLIEKYPQLSQYLMTGENGELSISDEGWDALAAQAQQQQAAALTAQMSLQLEKNRLEQYQAFEDALSDSDKSAIERERALSNEEFKSGATGTAGLTGAAIGAGVGLATAGAGAAAGATVGSVVPVVGTLIGAAIGALAGTIVGVIATESADAVQTIEDVERKATGGLTQEEFSDFAVAAQRQGLYVSGDNVSDPEAFRKLYTEKFGDESGWDSVWASMTEMGDKFDELAAKTEALRIAQETYTQSILTTAAQADSYLANNKFAEQAAEGVSSVYGEEMNELTAELAEKYMSDDYMDKDGNPTEKLVEEYADATGLKADEIRGKIEAKTLSAETMAQTVASKEATDIGVIKMKKTAQELTRVDATATNRKNVKALQNLLTDEGKKLTKKDLTAIGITGAELSEMSIENATGRINEYLDSMGTSLEALGIDAQTFIDNLVYGEEQLEEAFKFFDENEYDTENIKEKIDAATVSAFSKKIDATGLTASEDELEDFVSEIDEAVSKLPEDEAEKFVGTLSDIDWTVSEQVDGLSGRLDELGVDLSNAGVDVEGLEKRIKEMADASSGLTFEEQAEQLRNLFAIGEDIKSQGTPIKLSATNKDKLVTSGVAEEEDFLKNPLAEDQWFYRGDLSWEQLLLAIQTSAKSTRQDAIVDFNMGKVWGENKTTEIKGSQKTETEASHSVKVWNASLVGKDFITMTEKDLSIFLEDKHKETGGDFNGDGKVNGKDTRERNAYYNEPVLNEYGQKTGEYRVPTDMLLKEIPETQYSMESVMVSAEEIVSGAAIISDTVPGEKYAEEGKKYITTEDAKEMLIDNFGMDKNEVNRLTPEQLLQQFKNFSEAGKKGSEEEFQSDIIAGFYSWDKGSLAAQATSGQEGFTGENSLMIQALDELVLILGLTEEEIALYTQKLDDAGYAQEEARAYAIALASDLRDIRTSYSSAAESVGEYIEKMKQVPENSDQYDVYVKQIGTSLEQMYGIDEVSDEWIKNNAELLASWAEGSEEAYKQVGRAMAQFYMNELILSGDLLEQEATNFFKVVKYMDENPATAVFNVDTVGLDAGVEYAEEKRKQIDAIFANWNYSIQWEEVDGREGVYSIGSITRIDTSSITSAVKSNSKSEKWENPYDVMYNTLQKINETIREREKLERQYQRTLEKGEATITSIRKNKQDQLALLQEEANYQNDVIAGREKEIANLMSTSGYKNYAWVEEGPDGQKKLRINWEELNKIKDTEKGGKVEEYIGKLEEKVDSINEATDALYDIEDASDELVNQGKEEYLDFEQQVKDALVQSYQEEIDKLSEINDSINDANTRMIDAMRESIDQQRQERENEQTESDLADKEQRLAYLRADTSGAHDAEIMQLEKELADEQEAYLDSLIDQKIDALQQQNEQAAEQRERQIQIAQQQLKQYEDSGRIWNEVKKIIDDGIDDDGIKPGSTLQTLLQDAANFESMSELQKEEWEKDTDSMVVKAVEWFNNQDQKGADTTKTSENNADIANAGKTVSGNSNGGKVDAPDLTDPDQIRSLQHILQKEKLYEDKIDGKYGANTRAAVLAYQQKYGLIQDAYAGQSVLDHYEAEKNKTNYKNITGKQPDQDEIEKASTDANNQKNLKRPTSNIPYLHTLDVNGVPWIFSNPKRGAIGTIYWDKKLHAVNHAYKTGGLADYTGPAWLDGTKSKPELVLNAQDTQNFIQLKDILSSIMSKPQKTTENTGNTTFDIDINVETVREEADLEMISTYIENKITTSANYRNNNFVSTKR